MDVVYWNIYLEKVLLNQYLHLHFRVWRCIYHPELKIYLLFLFSPIILYYLWLRLCRILGLPQWLDIALLIRGETLGTATSLVVFVIVIVASSALFIMEANRSME